LADRRITFVIGAGASHEAGLPTGDSLKKIIAEYLQPKTNDFGEYSCKDRNLNMALRQHCSGDNDFNSHLIAGNTIHAALPLASSIDNFIHSRKGEPEIEFMEKLGISHAILDAESKNFQFVSKTNLYDPPNFKALENTWYNRLMKLINTNCEKTQLKDRLSSITLVIFNYNRCVEHFLYHALKTYYPITDQESADLINGMEIYHPYGTVGNLPWQSGKSGKEFGSDINPKNLIDSAASIKTFTEGTDPESPEIGGIQTAILKTQMVVFLGFGYIDLNLDLLAPKSIKSRERKHIHASLLGTAYDISDSNRDAIIYGLQERLPMDTGEINLDNEPKLGCAQLFDKYDRTLSKVLE
jgi:hemerythrin superfamily protein